MKRRLSYETLLLLWLALHAATSVYGFGYARPDGLWLPARMFADYLLFPAIGRLFFYRECRLHRLPGLLMLAGSAWTIWASWTGNLTAIPGMGRPAPFDLEQALWLTLLHGILLKVNVPIAWREIVLIPDLRPKEPKEAPAVPKEEPRPKPSFDDPETLARRVAAVPWHDAVAAERALEDLGLAPGRVAELRTWMRDAMRSTAIRSKDEAYRLVAERIRLLATR